MRLLSIVLLIITFTACSKAPNLIDNEVYLKEVSYDAGEEANRIKVAFSSTWDVYKEFAWGHDMLKPISKEYKDWYDESMMMTPIDAYDTMLLMGLNDDAAPAKALIFTYLGFDHDSDVQVFEVAIRILGGLLSAFELDGDYRFLGLAQDIADRMMPAFNSPTKMPYRFVNLQTGKVSGAGSNPAEIGTLMLEFGTLSKLLDNEEYYDAAKAAVVSLFNHCSEIGLPGQWINVETGEWENKTSSISGGIDSYYEYLWKAWLLFGDKEFKDMYDAHMLALKQHLVDEQRGSTWFRQVDMNTGAETSTNFGALDAFMPGLLSMSGEQELAISNQEACFYMWASNDIEPESFNYVTDEVLNPTYALRPENLESAFYLYRATGDDRYRKMGKIMVRCHF